MKKTPIRNLKFEEALARLDAIVEAMESGEIGIEESIARYEEAMALKAHCQRILDQAEQRIKKIQLDAAGALREEPFEPPAEAMGEETAGGQPDPEESAGSAG